MLKKNIQAAALIFCQHSDKILQNYLKLLMHYWQQIRGDTFFLVHPIEAGTAELVM